MFKRSTIINELGKRFVLDSNLSKVEFSDSFDSMTFEKNAGKYIITCRSGDPEYQRTVTASVGYVLSAFGRAVKRFDVSVYGKFPVCYDQHGRIASIKLRYWAEK